MKKVILLCWLAALVTTVNANTVWNPAANNITPPAMGNWNTAANWTLGVPVAVAPGDLKAVFNVLGAAECVLSDTQTCVDLVMGDGGSVDQNNVLRVVNGGTLTTTGGWMSIGYNRPATLIVEKGGVCNFNGHLWWGMHTGGNGTIILNGGTITGSANFGLGYYAGPAGDQGVARVYVNSGVLNIHHWEDTQSIFTGSFIDVRYGTVNITNDGNQVSTALAYAAAGKIIAFGGAGTLNVEHINGVTRITANDPMNPSPAIGATVRAGDITLSWKNVLDPNKPGDPLYIDVWFGTDPNKLLPAMYTEVLSNSANATSVTVSVPNSGTYYWQVDTHINGVTTDKPVEGHAYTFKATNDLPPSAVVIDTPNTLTWAGQPVQLNATITDDGVSPLAIKWSVAPAIAANVTFSPSDSVEDPIVTGYTHLGNITLTVTVGDAMNPNAVSDTMTLDVAESACQGARGGFPRLDLVYVADLDGNCMVNLLDFATLAEQWLVDYKLTAPLAIP